MDAVAAPSWSERSNTQLATIRFFQQGEPLRRGSGGRALTQTHTHRGLLLLHHSQRTHPRVPYESCDQSHSHSRPLSPEKHHTPTVTHTHTRTERGREEGRERAPSLSCLSLPRWQLIALARVRWRRRNRSDGKPKRS